MRVLKKDENKSRKEKGQSLVEFALTFSMIMLVLSGVADFGRAFFILISLNDAAQEGAMYGAMRPEEVDPIIDRVRTSSTKPIDLTDTDAVKVYVDKGFSCAGFVGGIPNGLGVSVEYDFNFTMPFLTTMIPGNVLTLKGFALHTILFPPCE